MRNRFGTLGLYFEGYLLLYFWYTALVKTVLPMGSVLGAIITFVWLMLVFFVSIRKNVAWSRFWYVFLYIGYLALIMTMSSKLDDTAKTFIKYSSTLLCIPAGYYFFRTSIANFAIFQHKQVYLAFFFIANILLANIFNWGIMKGYGNDAMFQYGNIFSDGLYTNVIFIFSLPLLLYFFPRKKVLLIGLSIVLLMLTLAYMKRTPLLCIAIGIFLYFMMYKFLKRKFAISITTRRKNNFSKYILIAIIIIAFSWPYFSKYITSQFQQRESSFEIGVIEEEGRYQEWGYVVDEIIQTDDVFLMLFGKELFNSPGNYAGGKDGIRQIHSDYSLLLHGSGVVGFAFYLLIQCYLLYLFYKGVYLKMKTPDFRSYPYFLHLCGSFVAIWSLGCVASFSGGLDNIICNSLRYLYLSGVLGFFDYYLQIKRNRL